MITREFSIFVFLLMSIMLLSHWVVSEALISVFHIFDPEALMWLRIIFLGLSFSMIAAVMISSRFNNFLVRSFYRLVVHWHAWLVYLFFASCLYGILSLVLPPDFLMPTGVALYVLSFLIVVYGVYNAYDIRVRNYDITLQNLPTRWRGKNIIFVSDFHLGHVHTKNFAKQVVDKVNSLNPHLVLIGGDLYDGVKVEEDEIIKPLADLKSVGGSYFITGNHEEFKDQSLYVNAISKIGVKVLNNEVVNLDGLQILGVDYRDTVGTLNFEEILSKIKFDKNQPSILLKHVPSDVDVSEKFGVGLQISGHTHRAQQQPLSFIPRMIFKGFDYGLKNSGDTQVITSSGVGTWGPAVRVGTNSEILLITLN